MALKVTSIMMNFTASLAAFVAVRNREQPVRLRTTYLSTQNGFTLITQSNKEIIAIPVVVASQTGFTIGTNAGDGLLV
jgi:hypothetical protein